VSTQLLGFWNRLRSSYWFVPALMLIGAVFLSLLMIRLDEAVHPAWIDDIRWLYINEPEGARLLLATIAGSMITVAGVTFSVTIVALTLASSQFGPRLLRNFMRNFGNQVVLGTYIATFSYCLLILRQVRPIDEEFFIPHLSLALALALATLNLGVLIFFIHRAAASIQISHILAEVSEVLEKNIKTFFPEPIGHDPLEELRLPEGLEEARLVTSLGSGYVQTVDEDSLFEFAKEHDLLIKLKAPPGHFVVPGGELVSVWPGERLTDKLEARIRRQFVIGNNRTEDQDLGFIFDQLTEVAVRALSPSMNDPFTAVLAVDRIAAGLTLMTERKIPSPYRYDDSRRLRVIAAPLSFREAVTRSFGPIRRYGSSAMLVVLRLFYALETIAKRTTHEDNRRVLLEEARCIRESAQEGLANKDDRAEAELAYNKMVEAIRASELEVTV
jgi:uncharacterized membrane protein